MTSSESQPRTRAGRLLLMAGLSFHSGQRLADHSQMIVDIEAEAAQDSRPLDVERLAKALKRTYPYMGGDEDWRSDAEFVAAEYARLAAEKPHATLGHSSWASLDAELAEHEDD